MGSSRTASRMFLLIIVLTALTTTIRAQLCPSNDIVCPAIKSWSDVEATVNDQLSLGIKDYKAVVAQLQSNVVRKDLDFYLEPIAAETRVNLESFAHSLALAWHDVKDFQTQVDQMLDCTIRSLVVLKAKQKCQADTAAVLTERVSAGGTGLAETIEELKGQRDMTTATLLATEAIVRATIQQRQKVSLLVPKIEAPSKYVLEFLGNGATLKQQIDVGKWLDVETILKPLSEVAVILSADLGTPVESLLPPINEVQNLQAELEVVINRIKGKEKLAVLALSDGIQLTQKSSAAAVLPTLLITFLLSLLINM